MMNLNKNPRIIGRNSLGSIGDRAGTLEVASVSIPTPIVASYIKVTAFVSDMDEDRGGGIIRIECDPNGSGLIPHAKTLPDGVELQLPGEQEFKAILAALKAIIPLAEESLPA